MPSIKILLLVFSSMHEKSESVTQLQIQSPHKNEASYISIVDLSN